MPHSFFFVDQCFRRRLGCRRAEHSVILLFTQLVHPPIVVSALHWKKE